ncbi:hypothetical protein CUMW_217960 [Citrus unshiu]|uniref:Uncharacterized protein n=1 Tax=Citrus unshiu TaxID=55188 RepID=A0A2H5QCV4_CITUN|nr:hypothetical protein CUMW_217960 [Citrus unshiu]
MVLTIGPSSALQLQEKETRFHSHIHVAIIQVLSIVLCHIGGIWLGKTNGITLQTKYIREAQEQMATIVSVFAFGE